MCRNDTHPVQCRGAKSFVDDLGLSRGVVLSRAAASLRSIETKPFDSGICPLLDGPILDIDRRLAAVAGRQAGRQAGRPAGRSVGRSVGLSVGRSVIVRSEFSLSFFQKIQADPP